MAKERPILFSTQMVQAILSGRKTMTRMVIKPRHGGNLEVHGDIAGTPCLSERCGDRCRGLVPPYEVGDVLWVRETWNNMCYGCEDCQHTGYQYKADSQPSSCIYDESWCPSIFMPREAARLFLRVTDVRVERVQEITTEDAKKEGAMAAGSIPYNTLIRNTEGTIPRTNFSILWDSLNAKRGYGWDSNPWVWVIEFERVSEAEGENT